MKNAKLKIKNCGHTAGDLVFSFYILHF